MLMRHFDTVTIDRVVFRSRSRCFIKEDRPKPHGRLLVVALPRPLSQKPTTRGYRDFDIRRWLEGQG